MSASSEWRQVERQLVDLDLDVSEVLEAKELQRLFLEVRGELAAEQVCHHPCRDCPGCLMWICKIERVLLWEAISWLARPLEIWGLSANLHARCSLMKACTTGNSCELSCVLQGFKALLESAPDITARTSWPLAKRQVRIDIHGCRYRILRVDHETCHAYTCAGLPERFPVFNYHSMH